jgi:hypothetical protein
MKVKMYRILFSQQSDPNKEIQDFKLFFCGLL